MQKTTQEIIDIIINSEKTFFILCGLPYSGKTHFAQEITKNIPIEYISIDDIFHERGYDWNSNKLPDEKGWAEIFDVAYKKIEVSLSKNLNVLYDSTNHTKSSRDALRNIAHRVGAETNVIFLDIPVETIYSRWKENKLNQTRHVVDKKLIDMTVETFEKPTEDENLITVKE